MSFWNKVKESANKVKESESWANIKETAGNIGCKVGVHSGDPKQVEGQPQCHLEYTCNKCNKLITKEKHKFPEKDAVNYKSYNSCEKELKCEYCQTKKIIQTHEGWRTEGSDGYCNNIEQCIRCKTERKNGTSHSFIRRGTDGSQIIVECTRCKKTEFKNTWHN